MAEWTSAGAQTGAILTVCGAEAAGKSTFAKLLANRLLSTSTTADESAKPRAGRRPGSAERLVYWLDLDPAHTEFCQPGEIALVQLRRPILGPNYTLRFSDPPVYKIVRSHAIGTLSPNDSFQRYSACAQNLVDEIRRLLRASSDPVCVVLVWCDLVSAPAIALLGQLTDVGLPSRMYHVGEILPGLSDRLAESGILERLNVKEAEALPSLFPSRTAAERRTMQSISYFHRQQEGDGPISTLLTPLSWVKPWIVSYSESCSDRIRFVSTGDLQPRSLLPTVINGAVVGISLSTYYSSHHHSGHHRSRDNSQGPVPGEPDNLATDLTHLPVEAESASNLLSPDWSENVGFGIVRGVDSKNECIHLLTPVDLASFIEPAGADGSIGSTGTTIVLVLGSIEYPGWAYMGDVHMRQIEDAAMQAGKASLAGDRGTKSVCQTGPWMSKVDDDGGLGIGGVKKRVRRM